ncbi:PhoX family phosphatase [Ideonella sp. 4Y16]|uniref:PhoX family protein n=1 Tax=Ideonella alba TaxID=2824118 RepID=UPI001B358EC4|nr:PhoX family phosphatase [Ideonella alba]MBQ0943498.1 PhoX family phosphatase [Ideonella alba]
MNTEPEDSNPSPHPHLAEVIDASRRSALRHGVALAAAGWAAPLAAAATPSLIGFKPVPVSRTDTVSVPEGYTTQVIAPWGDPVGLAGAMPAFRWDAGNSADEQAAQLGMHHDGLHFFSLDGSRSGLLVMNHEYVDPELLFPDGRAGWNAEKVRKSQAAHGVSVIEVREQGGRWDVVRPSRHARRITASTPMAVGGPAAGHPLLRTAADPKGERILGTFNNCASGITPWGTYLTCEENFIGYFQPPPEPDAHQRRWGLRAGEQAWLGWHLHDERFDAGRHPNEPNRFGWVVEIDPFDPASTPVKRTALGRAAHEGATTVRTRDGRAVVYMGEDAANEYLYRFVSRDKIQPGGARANATLLDHGTLSVARFDADGRGRWLPLVHGQGPLTAANGFADQGEVLVKARQASDLLGATKMDRPEWTAVDHDGWVYSTLTNHSRRGTEGQPAPDAANPRARNTMGQIIRWKEDGDHDGEAFRWNHFVLAGDPAAERPEARGNIRGDAFGCPDGLWVDGRGLLWIQTDMSSSVMGRGEHAGLGNNAMLAADPASGEVRRFLVGPVGCEITGATGTPDGRTMFINIQHPGEAPGERNDPAQPRRFSNWPDQRPDGRPRSATLVIRRADGGPVGS